MVKLWSVLDVTRLDASKLRAEGVKVAGLLY